MISLEIQAIDSQEFGTTDRIKLINSDIVNVLIKQTNYANAEIVWDSENSQFVWTGGNPEEEYEFFYNIKVTGFEEKTGTTSLSSYAPQDMGLVNSFYIRPRNKATIEDDDKVIYMFGSLVDAPEGNYTFGMFAAGNGT